MGVEESKAVVREAYEVIFNRQLVDRVGEFYDAEYVEPGLTQDAGLGGTKRSWSSFLIGVPDLRTTIVELVAEADRATVAWTLEGTQEGELLGLPAIGQPVRLRGVAVYRLAAGRITELLAGTSPLSALPASLPSGKISSRSTARSRRLLDEVLTLIPEIEDLDEPRLFDFEYADGRGHRQVTAGADRTYPGIGQITVHIAVGSPGLWRLPCIPGSVGEPCSRIEELPDGSTAYLCMYTVPNTVGHAYAVTLVKPDGIGVSVSSAAYRPQGADIPDAPLSLDRVLEIARHLTVRP